MIEINYHYLDIISEDDYTFTIAFKITDEDDIPMFQYTVNLLLTANFEKSISFGKINPGMTAPPIRKIHNFAEPVFDYPINKDLKLIYIHHPNDRDYAELLVHDGTNYVAAQSKLEDEGIEFN